MKKIFHLIPLIVLTVISILCLFFVFLQNDFSLLFAFILLAAFDIFYITSVYFIPFDEKSDVFLELPFLPLLFCYIPGATSLFLHMIPYSSPVLLLPFFSFILCLIVFLIKIKHYNLIKKHKDR